MLKYTPIIILPFLCAATITIVPAQHVLAEESVSQNALSCRDVSISCLADDLSNTLAILDNKRWSDQGFRDLAEILILDNQPAQAREAIQKIEDPDTRAMAIRKSGMALADAPMTETQKKNSFIMLKEEANAIEHKPSMGIALTYIAIAESESGFYEDAVKSVPIIDNVSLRNKAYAEIAEVQARVGLGDMSLPNVERIETLAFKNQVAKRISGVLAENNDIENAYKAIKLISNDAQKAAALQYLATIMVKGADGIKGSTHD